MLAFFFLLVGLEIRREMTAGVLSDRKAAILPVVGAVGGMLAPAAIYLLLNRGPTAPGWSVPTATDIAFVVGILALLGERVPPSLRIFVVALAVVDDVLSVLTLAIFYPHNFQATWLLGCGIAIVLLFALNRSRVGVIWPYLMVAAGLWFFLYAAGVDAALAGVFLAAFVPTRPAPAAGPLLAQAATALAELEQAEDAARDSTDVYRGGKCRAGMGEPEPLGCKRTLAVACRSYRACCGSVEHLSDPATFCVLGDGYRPQCATCPRPMLSEFS